MLLIVGLGNPGDEYRETRHNLGFRVLNNLVRGWNKRFKKGRGPYHIVKASVGSQDLLLAKPTTYMNRSGVAVADLAQRYNVAHSDILVLCDDLNLPLGKLRLRTRGSDGGHKGLASIISHLGTDEFPRLRMGIGSNPDVDAVEYVLSPFPFSERQTVRMMVERCRQAVVDFVEKGIAWTMNFYNSDESENPVLPKSREGRKTEGR